MTSRRQYHRRFWLRLLLADAAVLFFLFLCGVLAALIAKGHP